MHQGMTANRVIRIDAPCRSCSLHLLTSFRLEASAVTGYNAILVLQAAGVPIYQWGTGWAEVARRDALVRP